MKLISVKDVEEFAMLFIPSERTDLSEAIIDVIEDNLNNNEDVIADIKVRIASSQTDIILSVRRGEFLQVLEEQLKLFEEIEYYEECARISNLIKKIKSGSIVQSLIDCKPK